MNAAPLFVIRIADIGIRVQSLNPQILISCDLNYAQFLSSLNDFSIDVTVDCSREQFAESGNLLFDSGRTWKIFGEDSCYKFAFYSPAYGTEPYRIARADYSFTKIQVELKPSLTKSNTASPLEYPLDELIVQGFLACGNGTEVHACGVKSNSENGFLFIGQSGAGKTTTARIAAARNLKILSDDRIIIRGTQEGFDIFGTPWHGEAHFALPQSASLKAIFFLKQAKENQLKPLTPAEASARLFSCSFPPYYNPEGINFMLGFFEQIAVKIPCYELGFLPDQSVLDFLVEQGFALFSR